MNQKCVRLTQALNTRIELCYIAAGKRSLNPRNVPFRQLDILTQQITKPLSLTFSVSGTSFQLASAHVQIRIQMEQTF